MNDLVLCKNDDDFGVLNTVSRFSDDIGRPLGLVKCAKDLNVTIKKVLLVKS